MSKFVVDTTVRNNQCWLTIVNKIHSELSIRVTWIEMFNFVPFFNHKRDDDSLHNKQCSRFAIHEKWSGGLKQSCLTENCSSFTLANFMSISSSPDEGYRPTSSTLLLEFIFTIILRKVCCASKNESWRNAHGTVQKFIIMIIKTKRWSGVYIHIHIELRCNNNNYNTFNLYTYIFNIYFFYWIHYLLHLQFSTIFTYSISWIAIIIHKL